MPRKGLRSLWVTGVTQVTKVSQGCQTEVCEQGVGLSLPKEGVM